MSDDIIRGYSPEVMRRLLAYLKPYKAMVVLVLLSLTLATAAELLAPIVMRRALDDHLLHREYRIELSLYQGSLKDSGRIIGSGLYVPTQALSDLDRTEKNAARTDGWLDADDWYIFPADIEGADLIITQKSEIFEVSDDWTAISFSNLRTLSPQERQIIQIRDGEGLRYRSIQYLALLGLILIFTFAQVYTSSWIGQKVMADMRGALLSHILSQSLHYLGKTPLGSLVSRTANDVETIAEFFTNVTISFLKDIAIMIGVIWVLFVLDTTLAWVSLIAIVPSFILIVVFRNKMREAFRRLRAQVSAVNAYLSERISGMRTVQLFDNEKRSAAEFDVKGKALLEAEMGQMKIMAVFQPLIDLIASAAIALIIWYSTNLHETGALSLGVLIAFVSLIQKFFQPVKDIAEKFNILQSAMAGGERIFAMMDEKHIIPDGFLGSGDSDDKDGFGQIDFKNVHFSYLPGEPVLKGLNFRIESGSTVAIIGATGAGKTTIANLMTRLWDPQEGRILLNRRDIREFSLSELRLSVQPVQQDVFLFAGSIAQNISLGSEFTQERIIKAAKLAHADDFIQKLPEAYDTKVTEGAGNLSAGQRQLIAFARVIAHDPRVIILDEATANVDTETESLLQEGLDGLLENRTALIIAHRLSTIRRADRIIVLGHGKLLEEGRHEELMRKNGVYHNLYELQFTSLG